MLMQWLLRAAGDDSRVLISSQAEDENTECHPRFSMCVVNKTVGRTIHSFIVEIMAPYVWYQMLPQIYSISPEHYDSRVWLCSWF